MTTGNAYLDRIKDGAINGWKTHQVLPSLTGAQAALESGWGTSKLAAPPNNNQFGIKSSNDWTGKTVIYPTKEYLNGSWITVSATFRVYDDINASVTDHAAFFTSTPWRKENYKAVVGERDYKKACYAVKAANYATDPGYAIKLIELIEKYKLYEWDKEAFSGVTHTSTATKTTIDVQPKSKIVGRDITDASIEYVNSLQVTVIGDSLGVGTEPYLKSMIPNSNYDVRGSRQITHTDSLLNGTTVLRNLKANNQLKDVVVVILGTNRGLTASEIDTFMNICEGRKVLWVETASLVNHNQSANLEMDKATVRHTNAFVARWYEYVSGIHSNIYSSDKIHMTPSGYKLHAEFIVQSIYEIVVGDFDTAIAQATKVEYYGIEGFKLHENGQLEYEEIDPITKTKVKRTIQTEFRGLATDGKSSYIFNASANNEWNPQTGTLEAEWLEGQFSDNNLKGLDLLMAACRDMMQRSEPEYTYRVSLSYLPEGIAIGSEGTIIDTASNPPKYISARVSEITTSESNPELNEIVITNVTELRPLEKTTTHIIQQELAKSRAELMKEWQQGEPLRVEISTSGGSVFKNDDEVSLLHAKVFQNVYEVTDQFHDFRWERFSYDSLADETYNAILSDTVSGSVLTITPKDIQDDVSRFTCRVFDDSGKVIGTDSIIISVSPNLPGKSAYELWVDEGNRGTVKDFLESFKGRDGEQGIPGEKGEDGRTSYTHFAYANSSDGRTGFSTADSTNKSFMGVYTDFEPNDSADPGKYKWSAIKGPKGEDGNSSSGKNLWCDTQSITGVENNGDIITTVSERHRYMEAYISTVGYSSLIYQVWNPNNYNLTNVASNRIMFYDINKTMINKEMIPPLDGTSYQMKKIAIPQAARYVRLGAIKGGPNGKKDDSVLIQFEFGETPTDYAPHYLDFKSEIDTKVSDKANATETQEFLTALRGELQKHQQEIEAKATLEAVHDVVRAVNALKDATNKDKAEKEEELTSALSRLAKIENEFGDMVERWKFNETLIQFGEEGVIVGNQSKGTYLMMSDNRLSFFNNGAEIAFITGGMFQITQGIFIERIQIGRYLLGSYESDPDILVLRYVGG